MVNDRFIGTVEALAYIAPLKESIKEINDNREGIRETLATASYEEVLKHAELTEAEVSREQFNLVTKLMEAFTDPEQADHCLRCIDIYETAMDQAN